ncbi:MAG: pilus assembly protein PilM [Dehalococcoidales bacterium]|nr:pilus assembly protein PilM [Dehalococcoidales bacterium]
MAKKIVSLYIDNSCLRLMETRGKRVKRLAELPLDFGLTKVNPSIKEAELAAKLKQLLKAKKIRTKKVIVGLSGLHCLSRPITLPQLPKAMLEEAVMREAKRVLPVPLEQLYVSWQPIPCPERDKMGIFLVAIPCRLADDLMKILRQAGLKPQIMDIKPIALARVVNERTAIIVDVQPAEFDLVIMVDGVPQPVRTMPFPEEGLSEQEKLIMVRDELERTIQFYNSNSPDKPLDPNVAMFIAGDLADKPELCQALGNEVGHPVLLLTSPLKSPRQAVPTQYLVNVGLALKELSEPRPLVTNLNTMPLPYRPKPISISRMLAIPSAVIVLGLVALMVMNIQNASGNISATQGQIDNANHIIQHKQEQKTKLNSAIADLERKINAAETSRTRFTAAYDILWKQGDALNGDLSTTVSYLPTGVRLTLINHSNDRVVLEGTAPDEAEVLAYARNLVQSGRFLEVIISYLVRASAEGAADSTGDNMTDEGGASDNTTVEGVSDNTTGENTTLELPPDTDTSFDFMEFVLTLKKAGQK